MTHDALLHPDLADSARVLITRGRLLAEREPDLYRNATRGRVELTKFFHTELGWTLEVIEAADIHDPVAQTPRGRPKRTRSADPQRRAGSVSGATPGSAAVGTRL